MIRGGIVGGLYGKGGGANPVSYYYGKRQTKRVGQNYTPRGTETSSPAEFKASAGEVYNGGNPNILTILNGSAVSDIDIDNPPNRSVIQFPTGRYNIIFQGYSESAYVLNFRVELRQIMSKKDDIVVVETPGYSGSPTPARTEFLLSWHDLISKGTEQFYFLFPIGGNHKRSHFLRVEKVA